MNRLQQRDEALDAVKGVAILIVMLGHCIVLNGLEDPYLYDAITAIQMPLFMMVSGFVWGRKPLCLTEKPDTKQRFVQLGKRTLSYLLPFFTWLFLTHLTHPLQELRLQLFALDRGLWFLMTLWVITLVGLFASYVADYLAWKAKGNGILRLFVFCLLTGICYLGFVIQARSGNTFLSPSLTVKYMPFYMVGYLGALYVMPLYNKDTDMEDKKASGKKSKLLFFIWIAAILLFLYLIAAFDMIVVSDTCTLLAQMTASFLGSFACFYGVCHFVKNKMQKGLAFIGRYTLEIYVLHFRFARLLGIADKNLQIYSIQAIGWVIAAFALMSILTAGCIWVIKKIWILDLLLFGKVRK